MQGIGVSGPQNPTLTVTKASKPAERTLFLSKYDRYAEDVNNVGERNVGQVHILPLLFCIEPPAISGAILARSFRDADGGAIKTREGLDDAAIRRWLDPRVSPLEQVRNSDLRRLVS